MEIDSSPLNSSSIEEIRKESFDKAVHKSNASSDITLIGEVRKHSSWIKSTFLGRGSYGSVYLAASEQDKHMIVAIKSAEISKASSLMDEKRILTRLVSPFVVRCYGNEIARESTVFGVGARINYNLILEYCSGGSLADLIKSNGGGLSEKYVKVLAKGVLYGLLYIHNQRIIHCDIKPDNILLNLVDNRLRPNQYVAKIGDFGLAMEKGSIEYGNGCGHKRGTITYMAPELIRHGIVDYSVDTWAFGCTVLEMLTGQEAWGEYSSLLGSEDLVQLIGQSGCIPYIPDWLSEEAQDFLGRCLVTKPDSRWEISSLISHPFCNLVLDESHNGFIYE